MRAVGARWRGCDLAERLHEVYKCDVVNSGLENEWDLTDKDLQKEFMHKTINIIVTRDPVDMLPSFDKVIPNPQINDVGYKLHMDLLQFFESNDIPFVVVDSKQVLINPEKALRSICEFANIPFDSKMLQWQPQKRKEDGVWAKYWYGSVHKSSKFIDYKPKTDPFPEHLRPLLRECEKYYKELLKHAI